MPEPAIVAKVVSVTDEGVLERPRPAWVGRRSLRWCGMRCSPRSHPGALVLRERVSSLHVGSPLLLPRARRWQPDQGNARSSLVASMAAHACSGAR